MILEEHKYIGGETLTKSKKYSECLESWGERMTQLGRGTRGTPGNAALLDMEMSFGVCLIIIFQLHMYVYSLFYE